MGGYDGCAANNTNEAAASFKWFIIHYTADWAYGDMHMQIVQKNHIVGLCLSIYL